VETKQSPIIFCAKSSNVSVRMFNRPDKNRRDTRDASPHV